MEAISDLPSAELTLEGELDQLVESYSSIVYDDAVDSGRESSGPDEAVFDHIIGDGTSSPGTSEASDDDVSCVAGSRHTPNIADRAADPFTPTKHNSAFRTPSSVREMQLDTTPPHLMSNSQYHKYRLSTVSRNSTPKSVRSWHSGPRSTRSSPTKAQKKEYPLVLLHVTLLPVTCPYSQELMESMMPPHVIENWKLLKEKVPATVIDRGILIPHPREDYDILEERLLETLELKAPRILKCGHFHLTAQEQADIEESEDEYDSDGGFEICKDCGRRVRDGQFGAGSGHRRWSIKVYASNGLMKAGAWGAAWREMERVDVEILPWIEDDLRRQMDLRQEDEIQQQMLARSPPDSPRTMDEARRREIYGDDVQHYIENFSDGQKGHLHANLQHGEVPLSILLLNYVQDLLQDRRNVAIGLLSLCVVYLAFQIGPNSASIGPSTMSSPSTISTATIATAAATASASAIYENEYAKTIVETKTMASLQVEVPLEAPSASAASLALEAEEMGQHLAMKDLAETPAKREVAVTLTAKEVANTGVFVEANAPSGLATIDALASVLVGAPVVVDEAAALAQVEEDDLESAFEISN